MEGKVLEGLINYTISSGGIIVDRDGRGVPWQFDDAGWPYVELWNNRNGYMSYDSFYVDRLVAEAYVPNVEGRGFVAHRDGDKYNCNADNLEWCYMLPRKCPITDVTWTVYDSVADCVAQNFVSPNDLLEDLHGAAQNYSYVDPVQWRKDETIELLDRSDYYRQTKNERKHEV